MLKHRMDNLAVDCELGKLKIPGINNDEKFPEDSNTQTNSTRNCGGPFTEQPSALIFKPTRPNKNVHMRQQQAHIAFGGWIVLDCGTRTGP